MHSLRSLRSIGPRLVACGALVGAVAFAATPALAQVSSCTAGRLQLTLFDPLPGAQLPAGVYTMQGVALDTSAQQGTGVDRVQVFLGDRDRGGRLLATAKLGLEHPYAVPGSQFSTAGWSGTLDLSGLAGTHSLFAYARSSVDGSELAVSVPITIGVTRPSVLPSSPPASSSSCPSRTHDSLRLVVDNPQPGADLIPAPYRLQGSATDKNAQPGTSGIDRVQIFMGDPNTGGQLLVTETQIAPDGKWTATADLPVRVGPQTVYVIARSAVNGAETTVTIPVYISV
ncbi:MAG: hypothetical protein JO023_04380 [Chloroflexi bacterium]|nr:hypothetical protein [Chloroflexota bacterium]